MPGRRWEKNKGRGAAYGEGGGKEKRELHGQSTVGLSLQRPDHGGRQDAGLYSQISGEPVKGFTQRENVSR